VRNTRFLIPVLLVGCVLGLDTLPLLQRRLLGARSATVFIVLLTLLWWHWQPPLIMRWFQARVGLAVPATRADGDVASEIIALARRLRPGSLFLPIGQETVGLALRYGAFQPVAFLVKDLNLILWGGGDLRRWLLTRDRINRFRAARDPVEARALLRDLIQLTRADYLFVELTSLAPEGRLAVVESGPVVVARKQWAIVSVRGEGGSRQGFVPVTVER
jgi:hypothetical protein